jgi:hypothetical protein
MQPLFRNRAGLIDGSVCTTIYIIIIMEVYKQIQLFIKFHIYKTENCLRLNVVNRITNGVLCSSLSLHKHANNKKSCEQLIVYFPLVRHGPHRKRLQQFFAAAGTFLPSYFLAAKGGIHFTEPLPSNDRWIHIQAHRLMGWI